MLGESFKSTKRKTQSTDPLTIIRHSQPSAMTLRVLYLHESVHPDYVAPPAPQRFQRPTVTPEGQEIPQVRQPRPKVYDPEPCFSREGGVSWGWWWYGDNVQERMHDIPFFAVVFDVRCHYIIHSITLPKRLESGDSDFGSWILFRFPFMFGDVRCIRVSSSKTWRFHTTYEVSGSDTVCVCIEQVPSTQRDGSSFQ